MEDLTKEQIEELLIPTDSKTVKQMGYHNNSNSMYVKFDSGTLYRYSDTSYDEFMSIKEDQSIGSKLRKVVAGKEYKKL